MLNENSSVSLYHQLKEHILTKIQVGEWKVNERIPAERDLCELYKVSRITVRQALDDLAEEGYIYKKQGRGTFVKERKFQSSLGSLYSFGEEIKKMGGVPSSTILDFKLTAAPADVASKLEIDEDEKVYMLTRLRNANDEPYAFEISYIPFRMAMGLTREEIEEKGLYASLKDRSGIKPDMANESFEAIILPNEYAELLNAKKKSAGLLIERITGWHGVRVELCESFVRGDKYKYNVVLVK